MLVRESYIHLYKGLLDEYNDTSDIENKIKTKKIIIRILGNDLEQIHGEDETYANLKFTLENESEFIYTDKLNILNKIVDTTKKNRMI